jgi:four helix bundle protein
LAQEAAGLIMAKVLHYRELVVWQKSMTLAKQAYQLTAGYPSDEKFGLVSQMRRAAVSIPSNIAEGQARRSSREFAQFLSHALGSLAEFETQLLLSIDLSYCSNAAAETILELISEVRRMLMALRGRLETGH